MIALLEKRDESDNPARSRANSSEVGWGYSTTVLEAFIDVQRQAGRHAMSNEMLIIILQIGFILGLMVGVALSRPRM